MEHDFRRGRVERSDGARTSTSSSYFDLVAQDTATLKADFGWLLDRVRAGLSSELGAPVELLDGLSVPGFHVIPSHLAWSLAVFRKHADESYDQVLRASMNRGGDAFEACAPESRISFTLPISIPRRGGAGLNWLDARNCTSSREAMTSVRAGRPCMKWVRELYEIGTLTVCVGQCVLTLHSRLTHSIDPARHTPLTDIVVTFGTRSGSGSTSQVTDRA